MTTQQVEGRKREREEASFDGRLTHWPKNKATNKRVGPELNVSVRNAASCYVGKVALDGADRQDKDGWMDEAFAVIILHRNTENWQRHSSDSLPT